MHGAIPRSQLPECELPLSRPEEGVIIEYARKMDSLGLPYSVTDVARTANCILVANGKPRVDEAWARRFVERCPELGSHLSPPYDDEQTFSDDPAELNAWFQEYMELRNKYGIEERDVYNMDEAVLPIGPVKPQSVRADASRRERTKKLQPGNADHVSVIACVRSTGELLPQVIIFRGVRQMKSWYVYDLPGDWMIMTSKKGGINNEITEAWFKHFEKHTASFSAGRYRMLILDKHAAHSCKAVVDFCKNHKIVLAYLPAQASQRSQPLQVGCFSRLKRSYFEEIDNLIRVRVQRIPKEFFLVAFNKASSEAMCASNIKGAFREAGLVPYNPEAVLSHMVAEAPLPQPLRLERSSQERIPQEHAQEAPSLTSSPRTLSPPRTPLCASSYATSTPHRRQERERLNPLGRNKVNKLHGRAAGQARSENSQEILRFLEKAEKTVESLSATVRALGADVQKCKELMNEHEAASRRRSIRHSRCFNDEEA